MFSGEKGFYSEDDNPDPIDLYGKSKLLGEISGTNAITIRTSIIGHSLSSNHGLIDWFLTQKYEVKGYKKAIFSGLTTSELSKVIINYIIPNKKLNGLFNISSEPISKYDLLDLVRTIYKKDIEIKGDYNFVIDRSLNSNKFKSIVNYNPPNWETMLKEMYEYYKK